MESSQLQIVEVDWLDRWQIYHRLQALEVECSCQANQPLMVSPENPQVAFLVWRVVKSFTANRQELIEQLNRCWCLELQQ